MLPKTSRFTRAEFDALLKGGRVRNYPLFSLRFAPGFVGRKAAVVVSKKEAALASLRNRARRRVYAALRPSLSLLPARTGVAFFLRKGSLTATPAELRAAIDEALRAL
ncbi:MAG TPA: ribonuclease P protein component [Candidatus Paceibacterota bacterium]|nr:ribonuclease P protein component [Candidatus Paceibacterota bacterium]